MCSSDILRSLTVALNNIRIISGMTTLYLGCSVKLVLKMIKEYTD